MGAIPKRIAELVVIAAFSLWAAAASAQTSTMVLGIRPIDGEGELARNLTGALRHAASQHESWRVSERDVSLVQMTLAHDCDAPDAACMAQVAQTLNAQLIIYGNVRRAPSGSAFAVDLHIFNAATGAVDHSVEDTIPRVRSDIDDLRARVVRYVTELAGGTPPGTIRVLANVPGAAVSVDGHEVGSTDEMGLYTGEVTAGNHTVALRSDGYQLFETAVSVGPGNEETVAASMVATGPGDGPAPPDDEGGRGPYVSVPGVISLGVGAAFFGLAAYAWFGETVPLADDPMFDPYRRGVRDLYPDRKKEDIDACEEASKGTPIPSISLDRLRTLCDDASTWETVQYVSIGAGILASGIGAYLLLDGLTESSEEAEPTLTLRPSFGLDSGSVTATLKF